MSKQPPQKNKNKVLIIIFTLYSVPISITQIILLPLLLLA